MNPAAFRRTLLSQGLGEAVKTFRQAEAMDVEAFAEKAGLEPADVNAIERGEYNLQISQLENIVQALRVQLYQLVALGEASARRAERDAGGREGRPRSKGSQRKGSRKSGG